MVHSEQRIPELDGLRGTAVLMVLIWHFVGCMVDPGGSWIEAALYSGTIFGRTGVDLFFVLSGFLIIGILIDNRAADNLFPSFYGRRIARIFPAYFLLIVVYWLCYAATGPTAAFNAAHGLLIHAGAQVLFAYNWLMAIDNGPVSRGFSVTWSVAIEEQFYLVAPLVVWLTPRSRLWKVLLGGALFAVLSRAAMFIALPSHALAPYVLPFSRIDCLCAGGLLALAWRNDVAFGYLKKIAPGALAILSALAFFMVYCIVTGDLNSHMYFWGHSLLSAFYFFVLLFVLTRRPAIFRSPSLTFLGTISYGLYLFHPLMISLFFQAAGRPERVASLVDAGLALGALVASIAFCATSYFFLEKPIRRLGRRLSYDHRSGDRPLIGAIDGAATIR